MSTTEHRTLREIAEEAAHQQLSEAGPFAKQLYADGFIAGIKAVRDGDPEARHHAGWPTKEPELKPGRGPWWNWEPSKLAVARWSDEDLGASVAVRMSSGKCLGEKGEHGWSWLNLDSLRADLDAHANPDSWEVLE